MANKQEDLLGPKASELLDRKFELMNKVFEVTQKELLLVDLEGLTPLLEQKESLISEIKLIDQQLASSGQAQGAGWESATQQKESADLVAGILENESTLELRINEEFSRLRGDLREFDRQTRLKRYLQDRRPEGSKVDLKR